jgi:hypothetical protein
MLKITEWDPSSVERKFNHTYAFTTIENEDPKWRYIRNVSEGGNVTCGKEKFFVKTMQGGQGDYPSIEFYYKPHNVGWIHSKAGPVLVSRIQCKSYKIGLCTESCDLELHDPSTLFNWTECGIEPDTRVHKFKSDHIEILSPFLFIQRKYLYFLKEIIGFAESKKVYLNKPIFLPHVKRAMGEEWQINC